MIESLYLHIPFCSYKCPYCDFVSVLEGDIKSYLEALEREIEFYKDEEANLKTVYLGGGTPTLLEPSDIGRILEVVLEGFPYSEPLEITVECNPETYRYKEFKTINSFGVNRLSVGVQSFLEKGLKALGRMHTSEDSIKTISDALDAGIKNVSLDLIYAYPGQEQEDLLKELEILSELPVRHVSAYMLTAYENTRMGKLINEGKLETPSELELTKIYESLWKGLKDLGFKRYEISNWAKEGAVCRHNLNYWERKEFIGLGVSAWGFVNGIRYGNTRNLNLYMEKLNRGLSPVEHKKVIDEREAYEEEVFLGLRLVRGIDRNLVKIPAELFPFLAFPDGRVAIREEYMLLADEIISQILYYNDIPEKKEVSRYG